MQRSATHTGVVLSTHIAATWDREELPRRVRQIEAMQFQNRYSSLRDRRRYSFSLFLGAARESAKAEKSRRLSRHVPSSRSTTSRLTRFVIGDLWRTRGACAEREREIRTGPLKRFRMRTLFQKIFQRGVSTRGKTFALDRRDLSADFPASLIHSRITMLKKSNVTSLDFHDDHSDDLWRLLTHM